MKTLFKVLGGLIILVVLAIVLVPVLLKDTLIEKVKEQINENLNAEVSFGDFDLSLISTFPDLKFSIQELNIAGVDSFSGVNLLNMRLLEAEVDLMSVIKGEEIKIKKFGIDGLDANIQVLESGLANYDSAPASEETPVEEEASESTPFNLALETYYFRDINLIYNDQSSDMCAEIVELNHEGNGDFSLENFILKTTTAVKSMTYKMDGLSYLKGASLDSKFDIEMDMLNSKYLFSENFVKINGLQINFDGFVAMPAEDIDMDLSFSAPSTSFKDILSLIPAVYMSDFESVKTQGKFSFSGAAKGLYTETNLPSFNVDLIVNDAMFQYPDLPSKVENIEIDLHVNNPGGSEDNTVIDLKNFSMKLAENPVNMNLFLKRPISDPEMKGMVQTQLNLASLGDVVPLEEGETYQGSLTADVNFEGKLSSIEQERYEEFDATGRAILLDFLYEDSTLGYDVLLKKAYLDFSPNELELSTFEVLLGKSDLKGSGKVSNYLPYYFHDSVLNAGLSLESQMMDIDELMGPEVEEEAEAEEASAESEEADSAYVIEVPRNIDFKLKLAVAQMLYDGLEISNTTGGIQTHDGVTKLKDFGMEMLSGKIIVNGSYSTQNLKSPAVDFDLDIQKFGLAQSFDAFNTVKKLAPIAESAKGAFSTSLKFVCLLDEKMEPVMNSLTGGGKLKTHQVVLDGSKTLKKAAKELKNDKYAKLNLDDANISYEFKDGRVFVDPFDIKWADSKANVSGSNGFDNTLDYLVKMDIPSKDLGSAFSEASSVLSKQAKSSGLNIGSGDRVEMDLKIGGTTDDPSIKPVLAGAKGDNLKDAAKAELEKQKAELEKRAKEEAAKLKKQAEAEALKLKKEAEERAKKEADRLKKEAEAKAKKEAERLKKEAEEKAKKEAEQKLKEKGKEGLNNLLKKR